MWHVRVVLAAMWIGWLAVSTQASVAPFDVVVTVETGLGAEVDRRIAEQVTSEVSQLIYLTAAQRRALAAADEPPGHRLRVSYIGQTRVGDIIEKPASRPESPASYSIDYATRGKLSCTLLKRDGEEYEAVQSWEGTFADGDTLKLGRSQQEWRHIRRMAGQVVVSRIVVQLAQVVRASAAERFWPVQLKNLAPDKDGTVTGTLVLTNNSPWTMEFTPEVVGEMANPDITKPSRYVYLFNYPKQRLAREVVQPNETIERGIELALSPASAEQIAEGRVVEVAYRDFAFRANIWRARWKPGEENRE